MTADVARFPRAFTAHVCTTARILFGSLNSIDLDLIMTVGLNLCLSPILAHALEIPTLMA